MRDRARLRHDDIDGRLRYIGYRSGGRRHGNRLRRNGTRPITAQPIAVAPAAGTVPDISQPSIDIVVPEPCTVPHNSLSVQAEAVLPAGVTDSNSANNILAKNYGFSTAPKSFKIGW